MARIARGATAAVCATAAFLGAGGPASAATTAGTEAALRAAVTNASESSITLSANITLTCTAGGELLRNSATALTITGAFTIHQTCSDTPVFHLTGTGRLTLQNVTLAGATGASSLGIETDEASVTLDHAVITGTGGHGIETHDGSVTLTSSSIFGGSADGIDSFDGPISLTNSTLRALGGDGIASNGNVTLVGSTVSGNDGNGVDTNGRSNLIQNSTVTGNQGTGVATDNTMTLVYATVTNNNLADSAGFNFHYNDGGTLIMFGSVIAGNPFGANCDAGTKVSHGFNFSDDSSCGLTQASDTPSGGPAKLGALGNHGGAAQTLVPQSGSPLIDAIPSAHCKDDGASSVTTDERGIARPKQGGCDIGAVEVAPATVAHTTTTTTVATPVTTAAASPTTAPVATTPTTVVAQAQLPRTGSSSRLPIAGVAVLGSGLLLVTAGRRRRSA